MPAQDSLNNPKTEKQAVFRANYERLEKRIKQLAQQAEQELAGKTQRTFLIYCGLHICYFTKDIHKLRQIRKLIESALKTESASLYSCLLYTSRCV